MKAALSVTLDMDNIQTRAMGQPSREAIDTIGSTRVLIINDKEIFMIIFQIAGTNISQKYFGNQKSSRDSERPRQHCGRYAGCPYTVMVLLIHKLCLATLASTFWTRPLQTGGSRWRECKCKNCHINKTFCMFNI